MAIETVSRITLAAALGLVSAVSGETIVQEGSLSGSAGPPNEHVIVLDQFDTMDGTLTLNSVRLDFFIVLIAEAVTNGGGGTVDMFASLTADYFFVDETPIGGAATLIETTVDNTGPPIAYLFLDEDAQAVTYDSPADLVPWTGSGTIELGAVSQMILTDRPAGVIEVGAGGNVTYTVTYDYSVVPPCPADLDGSGLVDVGDLTAVILAWGTPDADATDDGTTDVQDLVAVISAWGSCD
ncbi:MAG: hypothetical protein ACYTGR_01035 [Planctomycetota bacterium]|jgi:hypothetical protein